MFAHENSNIPRFHVENIPSTFFTLIYVKLSYLPLHHIHSWMWARRRHVCFTSVHTRRVQVKLSSMCIKSLIARPVFVYVELSLCDLLSAMVGSISGWEPSLIHIGRRSLVDLDKPDRNNVCIIRTIIIWVTK